MVELENLPLVSVIMPLFNKCAYVTESIENVLNQTYPNIELIIVDDGSTDGSLEIARNYEGEKVKVIEQQHLGACHARNVAFDISKGEYIQYLDADDLMSLEKIEAQIHRLQGCSQGTMAICRFACFSDSISNLDGGRCNKSWCRDYSSTREASILYLRSNLVLHTFLIHRNLIKAVGEWNENLLIRQDVDFIARVIHVANKLVYCPQVMAYYRNTPCSVSKRSLDDPKVFTSLIHAYRTQTKAVMEDLSPYSKKVCAQFYRDNVRFYYLHSHKDLSKALNIESQLLGLHNWSDTWKMHWKPWMWSFYLFLCYRIAAPIYRLIKS